MRIQRHHTLGNRRDVTADVDAIGSLLSLNLDMQEAPAAILSLVRSRSALPPVRTPVGVGSCRPPANRLAVFKPAFYVL